MSSFSVHEISSVNSSMHEKWISSSVLPCNIVWIASSSVRCRNSSAIPRLACGIASGLSILIHCTMVNGMPRLSVDQNQFYYDCFWMFIHSCTLTYSMSAQFSGCIEAETNTHWSLSLYIPMLSSWWPRFTHLAPWLLFLTEMQPKSESLGFPLFPLLLHQSLLSSVQIACAQYQQGEAAIYGARLLSFLGRSEHTCGTRAQQEDSMGFELTSFQHLRGSMGMLYHFCISYTFLLLLILGQFW